MPAIFAILGYLILYVGLRPVWDSVYAAANMLMGESAPNFDSQLVNIYDPNAEKPGKDIPRPSTTTEPGSTEDPGAMTPKLPIQLITMPQMNQRYGNLNCERIGLDAPVYRGDNNSILYRGVGNSIFSFMPGFGRCVLVSGHNSTYFECLQYAEVGDIIVYDTNYETYKYRVYKIEVMHEKDLKDLLEFTLFGEEKETLVLYTCYPFHATVGRKHHRLVLFCEKIEGLDVQWRREK